MSGPSGRPWYHKHIDRMETERLLMECREDGAFLIRESDTVKGAYVLSTIYQNRIHHYRIIPDEEGKLSIQAQQGVQKKHFSSLEDLVQFYSEPKRGLVCGLTTPISQKEETEEENAEADDESDPDDEPDEVSRQHIIISKFLLASLSTVDTSKVDEAFLEMLKTYLNTEVSTDVESMVTPIPQLTCLKELFAEKCEKMHQQLDVFMLQVELVQSLFERAGGAKEAGQSRTHSLRRRRSQFGDKDFDSLGYKLTECSEALQNMETTAFQMFRELSVSMSDRPAPSSSLSQVAGGSAPAVNGEPESDQEVSFDVKVDVGLAGKKNYIIAVSLKEGTLSFCKAGESHGSIVCHQQLLQLVKSRSREQKLGILIEGQSRKDYNFNSMQAREHFCQLIQLIRNNFRAEDDQDSISVFVGTWNMGDASPPNNIDSWLRSLGLGKTLPPALAQPHDIYAIGTQECSVSEKEWANKIKYTLKNLFDLDYEKLAGQTLWGIRLMLFVKPEHTTKITHVQYSQVRTGIGNALGNKGAVGISFFFGSVSLCFINAHLTSGVEKYNRRNQNYHDILKGMGALKQKRLNQFDLTNQFHHLFFFGDLNYRVDLGATEIVEFAKRQDHFAIYQEDQLRKDKDRKKIFVGFEEAPILFPPTYRFIKNQRTLDSYVWHKQKRGYIRLNVPSFCDRVLWKSFPAMNLLNTSYGCTNDIMTSDHSPVFATFQIRGVKQYVPEAARPLPSSSQNAFIILDSCKAKIQTSSRTYFYIELYSTCFEGVVRSSPNNDWLEDLSENYVRPTWCGREHTAKVKPILPEQDFLEQQHVLVMLKSQESDEPYAECCISLRDIISPTLVCVRYELIHQGMSVGDLEAYMHVTLDRYKTEEEEQANIYSDVNFITAETEEATSLDFRGRTRTSQSESVSKEPTTRSRLNSIENRPRMPIPRTGSHSAADRSRVRRNSGSFAPPVPKRRETGKPPAAPTPYGGTKTLPPYSQGTTPPTIPTRRPDSAGSHHGHDRAEKTPSVDSLSSSQARAQIGSPQGGPPIPVKRKLPARPGGSTNSSPPPLPVKSFGIPIDPHPHRHPGTSTPSKEPLPPLPPKSPDPHPLPVARPRQAQVRNRPLSTVESLLETHGLQQFSQKLVRNGYDDIHFVCDISEEELKEIGIPNPTDRNKLLRVFASYRSQ